MSTPKPRPRPSTPSGNVISVSSDGPGPASEGSYEEFSLEDRPPAPKAGQTGQPKPTNGGNGNGGPDVSCPSCGAVNPSNNRHCQECGARLRQGPLPTAPRPAVQATAGVRAALAISGLLLGVILIALFFNIFSGGDPTAEESTTSTSTTVPQIIEAEPIEVLDESCTPQGIGSLICGNLTSGDTAEYQVNWEDTTDGVIITFQFIEPMAVTEIQWRNIDDDATRFRRNYRAKSLTILAQDSLTPVPVTLQDQQGTQLVRYTALNTTTLEIHIVDVYQADVVDDDVFDELAIDEIIIIGRPVTPPTNSTSPDPGSTTTTVG